MTLDDEAAKERLTKFMQALAAVHERNDAVPRLMGGPVGSNKPYFVGDFGPQIFRPDSVTVEEFLPRDDPPEGEEP